MENVIVLPNRYNDKVELHLIKDKLYKLYLEADYALRIGFKTNEDLEKGIYDFVDPSGGPFMQVGSTLKESVIDKIFQKENNIYIQFK